MNYRIVLGLLLTASLAAPTFALADEIPNIQGHWQGSAISVHIGSYQHRTAKKEGANFGDPLTVNFRINEQKDNLFVGELEINGNKETLVGAIEMDGKGAILHDDDGQYTFSIKSADRIDGCYSHATDTAKVASCFTLSRVK